MPLIISIIFATVAVMKFYGVNIIHRIKKISIERSENKKKYDQIMSFACILIGMVLLVYYLNSSRWFFKLKSILLVNALYAGFFMAIILTIYAPIVYREGIVGGFLSKVESSTRKRKVIYGCYITVALLVIVLIIWKIFKSTDYGFPIDFYFLGMDTAIAIFVCTLVIIISLLFVIAVTLHKQKLIILITTVISLIVFIFALIACAWTTGGDYYSFYSPDMKQSIIIEEWTHLIAEDVRVYERENIFFIKRIGSLPINSVYDFEHGNYDVEWKENKVVITLHKGSNDGEICEFVLKD